MKHYLKLTAALAVFTCAIVVSCQDEGNKTTVNPESLNKVSPLTGLLKRVAMHPTSADNVIDSTSCFSVQLPVDLLVNGQAMTVNSQEDYATVEAIFNDSPDNTDHLEYVFPITVTTAGHEEIIVGNQEQLDDMIADCPDLGGESIECLTILYPMTIFGYNGDFQIANTYAINDDAELFSLLLNLESNEYYEIDYPVSVENANAQTIIVNSNDELLVAIESAITDCDDVVLPPCLPDNLEAGLIAFYPFSAGSLNDFVGNAHLVNTAAVMAQDRNGNATCAYEFNFANGSFLTAANTEAFNGLTEMSISLWYMPFTDQSDYELLISRDQGLHCPDTYGQWSVGLYDGRRAVFGYRNSVWDINGSNSQAWYYLTATYNQVENTIKIYKNGVLQDSSQGIGACTPEPTVQDIGNLFIGVNFTGRIDDIAIYNRELTQNEIMQLYELQPCCQ